MVPQETSGALFRYAKPLMIHSRKADIIEPLERINMLVESSSKRLIISFAFLAGMTCAVQGNGRTERQSTEERQALLWSRLKTALTRANGKEYFQLSVKNVVIPGGADDLEYLRGTGHELWLCRRAVSHGSSYGRPGKGTEDRTHRP
jgi:hypothetical protein